MKRDQAERVSEAIKDFVQALIVMDQSDFAHDAVDAAKKQQALIQLLTGEEPEISGSIE